MIIGFVGFGKVSENLIKLIKSEDIIFITSTENRSNTTVERIEQSNIQIYNTFKEVAIKSDILISANSPNNALNVAKKYGKYVNGIYLDLNNISPDTIIEINKHVKNLVDGAIIGKIDSDNPVLYISGEDTDKLLFLKDFLEIMVISDKVGDASILKLLRSTYTKTLSALLIESQSLAKKYNLENEFFNTLTLTEGEKFNKKSESRIINTLNSTKRKSEELEQILNYFNDDDLIMVKAAFQKLNQY